MKTLLSRWAIWLVLGSLEIGLLCIFPPIHLTGLSEARNAKEQAAFDPRRFAADFWEHRLMKSLDRAGDAAAVLDAIRRDRKAAKEKYGRVVGLGGPHHYFVKGTGTVIVVKDRSVEVCLGGGNPAETDIVLQTSMIFGNQALNATSLIERSQFTRTNDYNEVSAAVNEIVEKRVIPPLLSNLKIGDTVEFVGCSDEVMDDGPPPIPLRLVPVMARVK